MCIMYAYFESALSLAPGISLETYNMIYSQGRFSLLLEMSWILMMFTNSQQAGEVMTVILYSWLPKREQD